MNAATETRTRYTNTFGRKGLVNTGAHVAFATIGTPATGLTTATFTGVDATEKAHAWMIDRGMTAR